MNTKAFSMALTTIVIWGSTFAAIRASLQGGYAPGHLVLVRYLIASGYFLLYALWPGVTFGEQTVSAGTAGMLIGSAPIFTAVIAVLLLKERLGLWGWVGLAVGFSGIVLITWGSGGPALHFSPGVFFVLTSALATSIFFVFQKPLLHHYRPVELTAYFTWVGTLPFFLFSPGLFTSLQQATLEAHLSALYVGIFPAAIAYVTWATALSAGRASTVTSMMYLEPAVAIITAWIWLKEWPNTLSLIGGIIALSGVMIVNGLGKRTTKAKE